MPLTIEDLEEKITGLTAIVEKQSALISKTGQQLLEIQVKSIKNKMNDIDTKPQVDMTDYVTNEDIVQLVGELQGQLDFLEDRTIARICNSKLNETDSQKQIAPISNKDGELPSTDFFPSNVEAFFKLDKVSIVKLCEYYELVIPDEAALQQFLNDDKSKSIEQANAKLESSLQSRVDEFSDEDIKNLQDELARFLGLGFRNNKHSW